MPGADNPFVARVAVHRTLAYGIVALIGGSLYVGVLTVSRAPWVSIATTALIAASFAPLKVRAERLADRIVYGGRSTPYEILSEFARQAAATEATEDVPRRIARMLVDGTGAPRVDVWLRVGTGLRLAACEPGPHLGPDAVASVDDLTGHVVEVRDRDELLGAIALQGQPAPVEEQLLSDLASQAGQVLRNVRLTTELSARLEEISARAAELRRSRQRIVAEQDDERRRLVRDIHDGAQNYLVALAVKLRLARTAAARDPGRARELVEELVRMSDDAIATLRELAGGIFPPLLAERGLADALRDHAARAGVAVHVRATGLGRYAPETEAAAYFSCLEAVQNAAKHARASRIDVSLAEAGGHIVFSVADDGTGFDPTAAARGGGLDNIADRLAALGGALDVETAPGRGTLVSGRLPARGAS